MDYLVNLNLNKNELQNAVIQPLATAPSNAKEGQIYYDSSSGDKQPYYYNGSAWLPFGAQKTTTTPKMNGTAAVGSETKYAAGDHVHPSDTTKADKSATVSTVTWDSTNNKLTKTINGTTSDVVTAATLRTGLNVANGAEVNQNAFSNVKVGNTTVAADTKTDTLELVGGTGISLTPDATNNKITISHDLTAAQINGLATYTSDALRGWSQTSVDGILSAVDSWIDEAEDAIEDIPVGAEVNQNAFSNVKVGSTTIAADTKTDTLELVGGTNISLTPDATNDKVTIAFNGTIPTLKNVFGKVKVGSTTIEADTTQDTLELVAGSNVTLTPDATNDKVTIAATDTTYSDFTGATSSDSGAHGLVPAPASGEEDYVLTGDGTWENINTTATRTTTSYTFNIRLGDKTVTSQTINAPSDSGAGMMAGIMTGADKIKLNGIDPGAEVNQNAFSKVAVSGQTTVEADTKTDTLTLAAGSNVTITTNASSDTVTIAATVPTITDTYSGTSSDGMSGKAVKSAIDALDGTISGTAGASKTLTAFSQTGGKVSATFGNISITKSQISDFPTLGTAAAKNYTTSITSGDTNLPTAGAVYTYIGDAISASDAMIFKGTIGASADSPTVTALPTTYKTGWTYRVVTAGEYGYGSSGKHKCEVGDLIIALVDRSGSGNTNTDWTVAQTNIDGAITAINGTTKQISVTGSGSSRTIALDAYYTTAPGAKGDTSNQTPAFGATFKVPSFTVDKYGRVTVAADHTVKIPTLTASASYNSGTTVGSITINGSATTFKIPDATQSAAGLMSATDKTNLDNLQAASVGAITHGSLTIAAGQTSVSASSIASKLITFQGYMGGEAVVIDYDGSTFSIAEAQSNAVTIKYVVTV